MHSSLSSLAALHSASCPYSVSRLLQLPPREPNRRPRFLSVCSTPHARQSCPATAMYRETPPSSPSFQDRDSILSHSIPLPLIRIDRMAFTLHLVFISCHERLTLFILVRSRRSIHLICCLLEHGHILPYPLVRVLHKRLTLTGSSPEISCCGHTLSRPVAKKRAPSLCQILKA